jgi:hypothetical protein
MQLIDQLALVTLSLFWACVVNPRELHPLFPLLGLELCSRTPALPGPDPWAVWAWGSSGLFIPRTSRILHERSFMKITMPNAEGFLCTRPSVLCLDKSLIPNSTMRSVPLLPSTARMKGQMPRVSWQLSQEAGIQTQKAWEVTTALFLKRLGIQRTTPSIKKGSAT